MLFKFENKIKRKDDVKKLVQKIKEKYDLDFFFDNEVYGQSVYRVGYNKENDSFYTFWFNDKGNESLKPTQRDEEEIEKFLWKFRKDINNSGLLCERSEY